MYLRSDEIVWLTGLVAGVGPELIEYMKLLKDFKDAGATSPPPNQHQRQHQHQQQQASSLIHRQGSASPPGTTPPREPGFNALEMSRHLSLWNSIYNNNSLYPGGVAPQQSSASPQHRSHSPLSLAMQLPLSMPIPGGSSSALALTATSVASPEPQREALDLGLR